MIKRAYIRLVARLSPDCDRVAELCSQGLDRPLTWRERLGVCSHYLICAWCQRYGDQIKALHEGLGAHGDNLDGCAGSNGLTGSRKDEIKAAIRGGADEGEGNAPAGESSQPPTH